MTKFILRSSTEERACEFDRDDVILGSESVPLTRLLVDTQALEPQHLRITFEDNHFTLSNLANDPFVTLNGLPFGRKKVQDGDVISLGGTEIQFSTDTVDSAIALEQVEETLEAKIRQTDEPIDDDDLDAMIAEVENLDEEIHDLPDDEGTKGNSSSSFHAIPLHAKLGMSEENVIRQTIEHQFDHRDQLKSNRSLKERFSRSSGKKSLPPGGEKAIRHHFGVQETVSSAVWRPIFAMLIVLLAVTAAMGSGIYFTFSQKSDEQEFIAAEGLADIAMAMTYSQLHQMKPTNQNWADPNFLHEGLTQLLPSSYESLITVDSQGIFSNCPYLLRVYLSSDQSHFLLVAQPDPSFWQWLIARETILLDSRTMELRKTTDLRALNRLLAHPTPLDGSHALEVSQLVAQADLVRLTALSSETGRREFSPPRDLSAALPGGELRLYNMPRYHRLTSEIISALSLSALNGEEEEQQRQIKQNVHHLDKFPQQVFFTTLSDTENERIYGILKEWLGSDSIPMARLVTDMDTGVIVTSYMLDEPSFDEPIALNHPSVHPQHPLVSSFLDAAKERRQALAPLSEQITQLLIAQQKSPQEDFFTTMADYLNRFEEAELGQEADIRQLLIDNYTHHVLEQSTASHQDFVDYAHEAGLEMFLPIELRHLDRATLTAHTQPEEPMEKEPASPSGERGKTFEEKVWTMKEALNFSELLTTLKEAQKWQETEAELSQWQNASLDQLEFLLFSADSPMEDHNFTSTEREALLEVLKRIEIQEEEQLEYYLNEFDLVQASIS